MLAVSIDGQMGERIALHAGADEVEPAGVLSQRHTPAGRFGRGAEGRVVELDQAGDCHASIIMATSWPQALPG